MRPGPVRHPSGRAADLVERCFAGLDRGRVWDGHAHLIGLGADGTGCRVNAAFRSPLHPYRHLQFDVYLASAGVTDSARADRQYLDRLLALHRAANPQGKIVLLAFDAHVGEDGREDPARTEFFVPNDYVLRVARGNPDVVPCVSVHPYRRDAVERLQALAAAGARAVKWLPNAMGIDPASPRCDPFYGALAALGLPLLTHAGHEAAVESSAGQRLGNPLRLRRAIEAGVRVVVAHCASTGVGEDLDAPGRGRRLVPNFDLFRRLFADRGYERTLFADVSALIQVNRCERPLRELLLAPEMHGRLVNGSDYPLCAIDLLISTRKLARLGYLDEDDRRLCEEVFEANPLLFDFVVKRRLRVVRGASEHRLADVVFETARLFDRAT